MAEEKNNNAPAQEQDLSEILKVRREKLKALQDAGRDPFTVTKFDVTHHTQDIRDNFDALEGKPVSIAGRLMSKRGMGKVSFCDLQDKTGRIQLYARKDEMDEESYNEFKKYDIGDIVGVKGEVFRTQRGEMSVRCKEITLLSKSLQPLPEKFHGLQDKEIRYRQRYVDLIVNPESKRNFEIRSRFVSYLRRYLDGDEKFAPLPDVMLIDGGVTHAQVAERVCAALNVPLPIFGMVKDDHHHTRALVTAEGQEIALHANPAVFALIGQIQDETHRFAITFHHESHSRSSLHSALDDIPGVGTARKAALLKAFKSIKAIREADEAALCEVVPRNTARAVWEWFHHNERE